MSEFILCRKGQERAHNVLFSTLKLFLEPVHLLLAFLFFLLATFSCSDSFCWNKNSLADNGTSRTP